MEILGLDTITLTIIIAVLGVGIRTLQEKQNTSWADFDVKSLLTTFMVSIVASIAITSSLVEEISTDADPLTQFAAVIGALSVIIVADTALKGGSNIANKAIKKRSLKN